MLVRDSRTKSARPGQGDAAASRRFESAPVNLVGRFFDQQGGAGKIKGENGVGHRPLNLNYVFHVNIDRSFRSIS